MRNGHNDDFLWVNSVQEAVGKPVDQPSSNVRADDWPPLRMLRNILDCRIDLVQEIIPETGRLELIEFRGVEHFLFCGK